MNNSLKHNILYAIFFVICISFWVYFTLSQEYMQCFNTDEFWAYDIASDLSFFEIIKLMHYEGHSFLWYMVLKPFTYFPSFFPFVMKYLNWFFCFLAMLLFWIFAPIKTYLKFAATLSSPFIMIYPMLGRCYGMALFFLFSLAILYKYRLKHPILFSITIFLSTIICIHAAFLSFIISIFFVQDILKSNNWNWRKKEVLLSVGIIVSGFLALVIQWIPIAVPEYMSYYWKWYNIKEFLFPLSASVFYKFLAFLTFVPLLQLVFYFNVVNIKTKRFFIIVFFLINIVLFFNIFISIGRNYHLYFLYVYLIVIYWLLIDNCKEYKSVKPAYLSSTIFVLLTSLLFNVGLRPTEFWFKSEKMYRNSVNQIRTIVPKGSTIYLELDFNQWIVQYIKNDYKLLSSQGEKIPSYKAYKNIYHHKYKNPYEIKLNKGENSYYIISKHYIEMYSEFKNIAPIDKSCILLNNDFYLCKLPLHKKQKTSTISAAAQIEAFIPEHSTIYVVDNINPKLIKEIRKKHIVLLDKPQVDISAGKPTYSLYLYRFNRNHDNCIKIDDKYMLCKGIRIKK